MIFNQVNENDGDVNNAIDADLLACTRGPGSGGDKATWGVPGAPESEGWRIITSVGWFLARAVAYGALILLILSIACRREP